jgi:hypothetical protein
MKTLARCALGMLAVLTMSGCATIVGGGTSQPVSLQSSPVSAAFSIQSSAGLEMAQGSTPSTVSLPRKNDYQVRITLDGYEPQTTALTRGINGWIWGNLFVGWILGFGIDFLTGSAYKLEPSFIQVSMQQVERDVYAVIQFLDDQERLIETRRLLMVPER